MTLPANISADLTEFSAAYSAAAPLAQAAETTVFSLALQAEQVVSDLDAAVAASAGALDTFIPAPVAPQMIAPVLALLAACQTQTALTDIRGVFGRIVTNLNQAV